MNEYPPNRLIIIRNLLISFVFFAIAYYNLVADREVFLVIVIIFSVLFLPQTIRLFFGRLALKIDEKGITDYTRPLGFIPWDNIKGAAMKTIFTSRVLEHRP